MNTIKNLAAAIIVIVLATSAANAANYYDDGSGYYGPGTQTGGPVGGLPDRN